jgi:hypothetical protein
MITSCINLKLFLLRVPLTGEHKGRPHGAPLARNVWQPIGAAIAGRRGALADNPPGVRLRHRLV